MAASWLNQRDAVDAEYSLLTACCALSQAAYAKDTTECLYRLNDELKEIPHNIHTVLLAENFVRPYVRAYNIDRNEVYIAFRGTTPDFKSLRPSLNAVSMPNDFEGNFQAGYLKQAGEFKLEPYLHLLSHNTNVRLVFTGHSLGGAIAAIVTALMVSHLRMNSDMKKRVRCVTFGAPHMCDLKCSQYIN
ncbi:unnamed protein product, partial [Didymodactylos carnosus]